MNIINKLTLRHLKQNKRRTLVTIIGVIISVAMVTAVATLGVSFMDLMQRQAIENGGEWHVQYKNVNKDQLSVIRKDEATKNLVISRDQGYAHLKGSQNHNKPYLFIKEYNPQGFEQFPIELSEGRFPQGENEIVISEAIIENAQVDYKLGDSLTLDIGQRIMAENSAPLNQQEPLKSNDGELLKTDFTESYTIVGFIQRPIWEPTWAPGYTIIKYIDDCLLSNEDKVDAIVVLKEIKEALYIHAQDLAEENNIETVYFNNGLLRYYGVTNNDNLRSTLYSLSAVLMAIIVIGSISLIYNAFAISVSERSRHLGMLSSVGATKKQKRNSVFFEGALIGLISIPIGIVCGLGGIATTFWFINPILQGALRVTQNLEVVVTPLSIIIACVISLLTIFISTYLPAQKASKVSAIDAIRQTQDVKLTTKAVKTSRLVRNLFGIEGEIGLKNLKRNKKRYQATVFSLTISIVLFLAVSFFTNNLIKSVELSQAGIDYDIEIYTDSEHSVTVEQLQNSISTLEDVTEYSIVQELTLNSWIKQEAISPELQKLVEQDQSILKNGKYPYSIYLTALDQQTLQAFAKEVGANYQLLQDPTDLACIVVDTIAYEDMKAGKFVETKTILAETGQELDLFSYNWETEDETYINKLKILALTDNAPMGVLTRFGVGSLNVIVSQQVLAQITEDIEDFKTTDTQTAIFLKSSEPMTTQQQLEDMKLDNVYVYNVYQARQQEEQMILIMSVFTYGFIVLITAISIANIFNTISTSIALRKREFAMLKSIGMTPKGFNKMINYESIFYGIKSLLYGLPLSIVVMFLIHSSLGHSFSYSFELPWVSIGYVIIAVLIIVSSAMLYSSSKVKKENIIDALKQENI